MTRARLCLSQGMLRLEPLGSTTSCLMRQHVKWPVPGGWMRCESSGHGSALRLLTMSAGMTLRSCMSSVSDSSRHHARSSHEASSHTAPGTSRCGTGGQTTRKTSACRTYAGIESTASFICSPATIRRWSSVS
eukprot:6178325-Pleurochrysis_carterae.AAC.9